MLNKNIIIQKYTYLNGNLIKLYPLDYLNATPTYNKYSILIFNVCFEKKNVRKRYQTDFVKKNLYQL